MALELMRFCRTMGRMVLPLAIAIGTTAAVAQTPDAGGYILDADDTVQVVVYGQSEFNVTTRIKSDGTIVMPLIGVVKAAGLNNINLAKQIGDQLDNRGLLKAPIVNVEVISYVSKTANVVGKVSSPGVLPLDRSYRVLEALLKTGWIRENAATFVYLRRQGQPEVRLEVADLVLGSPAQNPVLRPGDTLFVPDAEVVYLTGAVVSAGPQPIAPGMTVRQALVKAGGLTPSASSNKFGLIRGDAKEVDIDSAQLVQKDDVIVVKERLF